MKRLNRYGKKVLNELHTLENRSHNISRKLRAIYNTSAYVIYGIGVDKSSTLESEKMRVTRKIHKIRSWLMGGRG